MYSPPRYSREHKAELDSVLLSGSLRPLGKMKQLLKELQVKSNTVTWPLRHCLIGTQSYCHLYVTLGKLLNLDSKMRGIIVST